VIGEDVGLKCEKLWCLFCLYACEMYLLCSLSWWVKFNKLISLFWISSSSKHVLIVNYVIFTVKQIRKYVIITEKGIR